VGGFARGGRSADEVEARNGFHFGLAERTTKDTKFHEKF
jgi:hypothetical protein